MSRPSKFLLLFTLIVFVLACNFIPQQVRDVQNLANTAEAVASSMPNIATTIESAATSLPDFEEFNYFNPQGTPLSEWNGIPIMAQATAGEEFNEGTYSFKLSASAEEIQGYYNSEMAARGWSSTFNFSGGDGGAIMSFSKDSNILTVTITAVGGETTVVLTLG